MYIIYTPWRTSRSIRTNSIGYSYDKLLTAHTMHYWQFAHTMEAPNSYSKRSWTNNVNKAFSPELSLLLISHTTQKRCPPESVQSQSIFCRVPTNLENVEKSWRHIVVKKSQRKVREFCFLSESQGKVRESKKKTRLPWKFVVILVDYRECLSQYSPIWKRTCEFAWHVFFIVFKCYISSIK